MATQERDELHRLIDNLPDADIHDLLSIAKTRKASGPTDDPMSWIGSLHEEPGFARNYRKHLWAEQREGE
jgi:hypothetical protein